jgi:hypothetical protein
MPATRPTPRKKRATAAKALPDGSLPISRPSTSIAHVGGAGSQPPSTAVTLDVLSPAGQGPVEDLTLESAMRASVTTNSPNGSATVNSATFPLGSPPESPLTVVGGLSPPTFASTTSTTESSTASLGPGRPQPVGRRIDGLSNRMTGEEYIGKRLHSDA